METATSEGSFFGFGNPFRKRSATTTVTPIAAVIPPAVASSARDGRRSSTSWKSSGRVYLAKASSLISSKRDKEEAGGRLSDLVCCIEFDRGSAMLRTERGA